MHDLNCRLFLSYTILIRYLYAYELHKTQEVSTQFTWYGPRPAANFLLNLLQGKWCLKDKSILELGSGVGFLGISLMKSTKLKVAFFRNWDVFFKSPKKYSKLLS